MRQYPNDEVVRVAATEFFSELLTWFNLGADQTTGAHSVSSHGRRKFTMVVGHTENIAKIVLALKLDPSKYNYHPYYASNFFFELYHDSTKPITKGTTDKKDFYVVVKYNDEVVKIDPTGTGCSSAVNVADGCRYDEFVDFINTRIWTKTSLHDYCYQSSSEKLYLQAESY